MANLNVTYQDMEDAAGRLVNGQHEIEAKLSELKRLIDGLVAAGYVTDRSSKAFDSSYAEFNDGATKTIGGLEGMSSFLKNAAHALSDTDSQLANSLGK
ncbi:MAG: WXG100 family type VII secretion target [Jatrophihabitans sp.]|uniref:WXG100 family type VII secretion target n=1 Tax=Jatrophihabitans sp. TaxID=1932789 RepID=UPI003F7F1A4A